MIIQSLLDTDLYKFTMMQVVLHHFPGAQVEYKFKCRTEGVDFRPYFDEIRNEITALGELRFREDELAYLRGLRFMKSDFVDFLALFHFNEKYVRVGHGERPGEMDVTIRGPWLHTIMYEIPVLAIVSEIYFRRTQPRPDLDEGRRRLKAKIDLVRTVERELDFRIAVADTYGTDAFLRDYDMYFCKLFDGARHDSGDPFDWGEKLIAHYRKNRVDPRTKQLIFSDQLSFPLAIAIARRFYGRAITAFGIGTNLTNDLGHEPINIVIKMTECNGQPVAKVSDSPGKTISKDAGYLRYLRQVSGLEPAEKI